MTQLTPAQRADALRIIQAAHALHVWLTTSPPGNHGRGEVASASRRPERRKRQ